MTVGNRHGLLVPMGTTDQVYYQAYFVVWCGGLGVVWRYGGQVVIVPASRSPTIPGSYLGLVPPHSAV